FLPMAHTHVLSDTTPAALPAAEARRARTLLTVLVVPLLLATLAGLVWLWPSGESPVGSVPLLAEGMSIETAEIVEVTGTPGEEVRAELLTGVGEGGVIPVQMAPWVLGNGTEAGGRVGWGLW